MKGKDTDIFINTPALHRKDVKKKEQHYCKRLNIICTIYFKFLLFSLIYRNPIKKILLLLVRSTSKQLHNDAVICTSLLYFHYFCFERLNRFPGIGGEGYYGHNKLFQFYKGEGPSL